MTIPVLDWLADDVNLVETTRQRLLEDDREHVVFVRFQFEHACFLAREDVVFEFVAEHLNRRGELQEWEIRLQILFV